MKKSDRIVMWNELSGLFRGYLCRIHIDSEMEIGRAGPNTTVTNQFNMALAISARQGDVAVFGKNPSDLQDVFTPLAVESKRLYFLRSDILEAGRFLGFTGGRAYIRKWGTARNHREMIQGRYARYKPTLQWALTHALDRCQHFEATRFQRLNPPETLKQLGYMP